MSIKNGRYKKCHICKKYFYVARWEDKRKYCSSSCQTEGKKLMKLSDKHKFNISKSLKGRILSDKHKNNLSKAISGKIVSMETREKIRKANLGEKNYNWKGGISNSGYSDDWGNILREEIRKRDNFICQECGIHQDELDGWNKKLDVHHIDYNKHNCNKDNLITLCRSCHLKTNSNREYWIKYFKN